MLSLVTSQVWGSTSAERIQRDGASTATYRREVMASDSAPGSSISAAAGIRSASTWPY